MKILFIIINFLTYLVNNNSHTVGIFTLTKITLKSSNKHSKYVNYNYIKYSQLKIITSYKKYKHLLHNITLKV